ncbi:hydrophobin [Moniliophthora roreri MCA 2997]|uniref:Hydrophobin n=2 Tax=Moniliophthora roreri TaxID=221103 RepID=V2WEW0_MONRO|nr:hydrophobin [Moniliophthora roreri MCA 2997]
MQLKLATLSALSTLAAAGLIDLPTVSLPGLPTVTIPGLPSLPTLPSIPASQCTTGPIQCCNTVQSATDPAIGAILGLLGVVLQDLNVEVGVTCTPITVIGAGGVTCSSTPVCCENNTFKGLIAIGCVPVDISL